MAYFVMRKRSLHPRPRGSVADARNAGFLKPAARCLALVAGLGAALLAPFSVRAAGNPASQVTPVRCERTCLTGLVDQVLDAMAAKDVARLPLAANVKATENGVECPVWDGLRQTASARGRYRLVVADPESGQAGFIGTMMENGRPVYVALRIALREQKIAEIESVVARGGTGGASGVSPGAQMEERGAPRAQFLRTVPERERMSRVALIAAADSYFAHLEGSTGKTSAIFAKSCERIENGGQTTNLKTSARAGRSSTR
jgi:hypothetical protein